MVSHKYMFSVISFQSQGKLYFFFEKKKRYHCKEHFLWQRHMWAVSAFKGTHLLTQASVTLKWGMAVRPETNPCDFPHLSILTSFLLLEEGDGGITYSKCPTKPAVDLRHFYSLGIVVSCLSFPFWGKYCLSWSYSTHTFQICGEGKADNKMYIFGHVAFYSY